MFKIVVYCAQVIPQLIARIDTPLTLVSRLVDQLLVDIGKQHPQALVYPLTVASKSVSVPRRNAANRILKTICVHSMTLVRQTIMVSDELLRVAILWHEMWHEGLEEASKLYYTENNLPEMFKVLEQLHAMLEKGPQTMNESSFQRVYTKYTYLYKYIINLLRIFDKVAFYFCYLDVWP